jgi:hypothetical protein
MLTFNQFTGINNILPDHRLKSTELRAATNVDVGYDGEIRRRQGYAVVSEICHKNLWQGPGFMLATANGDLVRTTGESQTVLLESLGVDRVWYCNLPDGRVTFSNGLINGVTDGTVTTGLGVPLPISAGVGGALGGSLAEGEYRWALTHVRLVDGLEGGAVYSEPLAVPENGGFMVYGIPEEPGYATNVYLSNGEAFFYAGRAVGATFSYLGKNAALVLPLRTDHIYPMPIGTVAAFWRGRLLVAKDGVLWASLPHSWEHCNLQRDFKQLSAPITLIQPVDDGIYVGTTEELAFLSGDQFDKLEYRRVVTGGTVLGSGVEVDAEQLKPREGGNYRGTAMVCIADGGIIYGYSGGSIWRVTEKTYRTPVTEVAATFRMSDGVPQYVAVPQ